MKIRQLHLKEFGVHRDSTFELSPGVTLITAANGKGKTTLASAVTWLLWGKLIRPLDLACGASVMGSVQADGGAPKELHRRILSQGEVVDFADTFKNSNKTRAAETLSPLFGRWDSWKRTLHITGRTVAAFSLGTPKEKLDQLVAITGADKYDTALEAAKSTEKQAASRTVAARAGLDTANQLHLHANDELADITRTYKFVREAQTVEDVQSEHDKCEASVIRGTSLSASLEKRHSDLARLIQKYDSHHRRIKADAQKSGVATCGACGSTIYTAQDRELQLAAAEYEALRNIAQAQADQVLHSRNTVTKKLTGYLTRLGELRTQLSEHKMRADVLLSVESRTLRACTELLSRRYALAAAQKELDTAVESERLIAYARAVLVRSRTAYLRRYADRIQAFANYYMEQIGSSIRLVLEYQQGKLVVTTSGGYEYLSLSEGEKRRLDLCLVLAMSQVAAETGTVPASAPLIVDEAFDTLDADGVAALISLACVVAQRRQVLLISHAEPDVPKGADVWHIKL